MRILSCRIENFGKLHDLEMSFSDGLTVICRENGWGKSTLAAFIKAMLYGLEGGKKRDLDENERKRFCPWQGGVYGGRLTFEVRGRKYTVTRTFGSTPNKDTFELRNADTNLVSHDYSERLGEELFKLNSASFYRSIFIGQSDCPTSSTDDIHAKIGDLADNTGDMNNFEAADERLKKQINSLSPKLKTGSLYKRSVEIADLRRRVGEGSQLSDEIAECENSIADAEKQKNTIKDKRIALEAEQKKSINLQKALSLRSEWDRLKNIRDNSEAALEAARAKFPADIPDEEAVREHNLKSVDMKSAESLMHSYRLSEHEEEKRIRLNGMFDREVPSSGSFDRFFSLEQELRRVREKYERLSLSEYEQDRMAQLNVAFAEDDVTPSELAARWNERVTRNNALGSKRSACAAIEMSVKKARSAAKRRSLILSLTGSVIIILAVLLFVYYSDVRALAPAIAGIALLGTGIFLSVMIYGNIIKKAPEDLRVLREEISSDERYIIETDALTEDYLSVHGMLFSESDVPAQLEEICGEKRDLEMLRKKHEFAEKYRQESNLTALSESVGDFLRKFGIQPESDRLSDQLHELKESVSEYEILSEKHERFENAQQEYNRDREAIRQFLEAYRVDVSDDVHEGLEGLRIDLAEYGRLHSLHQAAGRELEAFEQSHDISALQSLDAESIPSPEALSDEIRGCGECLENLGSRIYTLTQKRDDLYNKLAAWECDNSALREKTEKQEAEFIRYNRLIRTRELLRTAKENMVARYVEPVYTAFKRYHETVTGLSPDNYRIDADVNLTVEELGQQREIKSLSAGFRDLAGICLRLGLADAMYRDEKPMLIMDDPFTNLDDGKASSSKTLLHAVAENYQVIYFTCSSTRK